MTKARVITIIGTISSCITSSTVGCDDRTLNSILIISWPVGFILLSAFMLLQKNNKKKCIVKESCDTEHTAAGLGRIFSAMPKPKIDLYNARNYLPTMYVCEKLFK